MTNPTQTPVSAALSRKIEEVLRARLTPYGLSSVKVYPDEDHDGEPVLRIEARYDLSERPVDSRETYAVGKEVWDAVRQMGESRFPHVRHLFDENQKVAS